VALMKLARLTKDELLTRYPETASRQRLLDVLQLRTFLVDSILARDYKIPDEINNAIALSPSGTRIHQALITKQHVPAKEARLICFLTLAHVDLLVDLEKTDIEAIRASIHQQVVDRQLLFPFVFGRELYDQAARLFDDERGQLSYEDTLRLLEALPTGVFQLEQYVSGPYGLLQSPTRRWIEPTTDVPMFHCADLSCNEVHTCRLSTDSRAPINEHRPKVHKLLMAESADPSAWGSFFSEIAGLVAVAYDDRSAATLPYLLGDGLSTRELRTLVADLLDSTKGEFRAAVASLGIKGQAEAAIADETRAQLLQLALLARDETLVATIDRLTADGAIKVPPGEVRAPVVNNRARSGRYGLQGELGQFGVRFHAKGAVLAPLRLRRLVDRLYLLDQDHDISELEWQLRGVDAPTLTEIRQ